MTDMAIRTGDTVYHHPSKETWIVAYADYERGELAWVGWPPGHAELSDCRLVKSCSDDEHLKELTALSQMRGRVLTDGTTGKSYALLVLEDHGQASEP